MVQIRGIVKIAERARESLKNGVSAGEVAAFKQFVADSVETIERLCAEANAKPSQLPARSRQAYYFLKRIDLNNLPSAAIDADSQVKQPLRLKNIKTQQRSILQKISRLAAKPIPEAAELEALGASLEKAVADIEKFCQKQQATPANLSSSARSIYAWMKFLTLEGYLAQHIETTYRARQMAVEIWQTRFPASENVTVELSNIAGLYQSRRAGDSASIAISEGFVNASDEVLRSLVGDALLGKSKQRTQLLKEFACSEEYGEVLLELDLIAEAIAENSRGKFYNLDELFDKLNGEYFASKLAKPRLAWSQIPTYRKFGHYEPARDRVVMSLTLDDARLPPFVVEFVLYHELLHKYHGFSWVNGRRMAHTPEFRRDERAFKLYQRASEWLDRVARGLTN